MSKKKRHLTPKQPRQIENVPDDQLAKLTTIARFTQKRSESYLIGLSLIRSFVWTCLYLIVFDFFTTLLGLPGVRDKRWASLYSDFDEEAIVYSLWNVVELLYIFFWFDPDIWQTSVEHTKEAETFLSQRIPVSRLKNLKISSNAEGYQIEGTKKEIDMLYEAVMKRQGIFDFCISNSHYALALTKVAASLYIPYFRADPLLLASGLRFYYDALKRYGQRTLKEMGQKADAKAKLELAFLQNIYISFFSSLNVQFKSESNGTCILKFFPPVETEIMQQILYILQSAGFEITEEKTNEISFQLRTREHSPHFTFDDFKSAVVVNDRNSFFQAKRHHHLLATNGVMLDVLRPLFPKDQVEPGLAAANLVSGTVKTSGFFCYTMLLEELGGVERPSNKMSFPSPY